MELYNYLSISISADTSALDIFVAGTDEVYVVTPVSMGWRFSRVTRRGTVSVTVADGRILPGGRILDLIRIAAACPGGGKELYDALAAAEIPQTPLRAPEWMLPSDEALACASGTAVRTFLAGRDIERMLSFPFQPSTAAFACTILAPATAAMRPAAEEDAAIARISTPVERRYTVVYPDGVRPSTREIACGETLTLTYYAEGCKDAVHTVEAGRPSPFVEYDGAAMRVRPLSAMGIKLEPLASPAPSPAAEAAAATHAPQAVRAKTGRTVTMVMRFSDDRLVRSSVTLEPDSSEYRLLRSGMFHGHRARRLAVKSHGDESYLIDLRSESPAPSEAAAATPAAATSLPSPEEKRGRSGQRRASAWLWVILTIAAIGLGIVAVSYLPELFRRVDTYDDMDVPAAVTDTAYAPQLTVALLSDTAVAVPAPVDTAQAVTAASADPSADYDYLNRSVVWQRDSLTSPEALGVFDAFATGNLATIPAVPFFASGRCTNVQVLKTVKLIWEAKGSLTQTSNERKLRALKGSAAIDFNELFNTLAGVRPSNPNKRPLPGRD